MAPKHIAARWQGVRRFMRSKNLDAFLATSSQDVSYLSDFSGEDSYLLLGRCWAVLISDSRYSEQAGRECPWVRLVERQGPISAAVGKLASKRKLCRIGFEPAAISVSVHRQLGRALGPIRLVGTGGFVGRARRCKDARELATVRRSIKIAQEAFLEVRDWLRIGVTELEVAARLEAAMKIRGSSEPAFPTIVACGANSSMPHAQAGSRRIRANQPVLIDWGATVGGYKSDLTRVLMVGRICHSLKRAYEVVRQASRAAVAEIKPGIRARQVDTAAREVIVKAGYGKYFGHGLGHGIGRDVHEGPIIGPRSADILEEGMIFTVEPGIYLPGVGGIRIENDILVTGNGCRILSKLPDDLTWALVPASNR